MKLLVIETDNSFRGLLAKAKASLRGDGVLGFLKNTYRYFFAHSEKKFYRRNMKDILFINGCTLSHPERYRVDHQMEQLNASGLKVDKVFVGDLDFELLKYYRGFVIFRCPINPQVAEFIRMAKYFNKKVFFDIDDLVVNRKFTDTNEYVQQMGPREKWGYDCGVMQMEKTLKLCDYLITSTNGMAKGLEMYGKEICVNRNTVSEEMVKLSVEAVKNVKKNDERVTIGYLSGSISHNPDMELIKPVILRILEEYENVDFMVVGLLDVPDEFGKFGDRIKAIPFGDWRKLPEIIANLDINLAPLTKTIFNEAKSENKWTEAALCKVVTVASDIGAFSEVIEDGVTGILCKNRKEWYEKIKRLVEDVSERQEIAERAFAFVMKNYVTTYTGGKLKNFIESRLATNLAMVLPSTDVSGGVMLALKHCQILREYGYDVLVLNMDENDENVINGDGEINVISFKEHDVVARFDVMVATMHLTLDFVKRYPDVKKRMYLVQGKETDFYEHGSWLIGEAGATYNDCTNVEYITVSKWCKDWLWEEYGKRAKYAPNGIDLEAFTYRERKFADGAKVKILVEGDSANFYKNIDESFKIANKLDRDRYEIIYLSSRGEPKKWYRFDRFYKKVAHDKVARIYEEADILLKSSKLESFSYPPLEMMATGGFVVVSPNAGNVEYLKDGENCLFYESGDIEMAIEKIERLVEDGALRKKLTHNMRETVKSRDWKKIESDVMALYGDRDGKRRKPLPGMPTRGNNEPIVLYKDIKERLRLVEKSLLDGKKIALYLVENKLIAQFRYRCQNTLEATLKSNKWQSVYFTLDEIDRLREILPKSNLFIIERQIDIGGRVRGLIDYCRKNNVRVIYDIDDLVFSVRDVCKVMRSVNSKDFIYWLGYVLGIRRIAKRADGLLTTNKFLGEKAEKSLRKPYKVIRNSLNSVQLEVSKGCLKEKKKEGVFRVGYFSGTPTHTKDLKMILPELERFLDKYNDTVVEIVGYMDLGMAASKMIQDGKLRFSPPVDFAELQEKISEVDVNIAPLVENDFTNCKSELKFFEAAIVETTTIASPTYTFRKAIKNGENGYLARSSAWYKKLEHLYKCAEDNKRVAGVAREYALKHYYGEEVLREVEEAYDYLANI